MVLTRLVRVLTSLFKKRPAVIATSKDYCFQTAKLHLPIMLNIKHLRKFQNAISSMQDITLDFTKCKYLYEVHAFLKVTVHFPNWCDINSNALWDCLNDCCGKNRCICIRGTSHILKEFDRYAEKILKIFKRVHLKIPQWYFGWSRR